MPTNTKEIGFEEFIEQFLVEQNGYRSRPASAYLKNLCMDPELVLEFIENTQSEKFNRLLEIHGDQINDKIFNRLDKEIRERGTLDVLRNGFSDHGQKIDLAYFKPNSGMNPESQRLYDANVFSVMRQVHYSAQNENSIDIVLFLNGLPIFTVELKNQLSGQNVKNAVQQFRVDRDPKELLLQFKRCLAHFAVDTDLVYMTTQLRGLKTFFLPFNKGYNHGAGNPSVDGAYKSSYLWEDVWSPDSVLELVKKFITVQIEEKEDERGRKYKSETLIFPRYHQRDTVKRLIDDAQKNGPGQNYLIQHSAGSGKSNTIAWTAHRLSELYGEDDKKMFDTVLVITDRRVLDKQLRDTIKQYEQVQGVVKAITENSGELKDALESGEKIIITTLQKFPFIIDTIESIPGRNFAVLIDEAHSSQSGDQAAQLREVLQVEDLDDAENQEESFVPETTEDKVIKKLRSRKVKTPNISFLAFTATPKQRTLELFGTKNPLDGKYYPFSLYSMKQATEEEFILDVLKNYTTYKAFFNLMKSIEDDPEFEKSKAQRLLVGYVEKHEHAIGKKTEVMIEHFRNRIAKQIHGKAKAMVVTKSRLHAVRYKLAFDKYLAEHNYPFKAMVAFSGTVRDGAEDYTEAQMNGVSDQATAEEFKKDSNKFLIVAEKFQTGFDQPLLDVMYVDKKLSGVGAVQTLGRLNRCHSGKDEVFVLDFVNEMDEIKEAFQPYYVTTVLSEGTDPNLLHDLERDLYAYKLFTEHEVTGLVENLFNNVSPDKINSALDIVVTRYEDEAIEVQDDFKKKCKEFVRRYAFAAQIIPFESSELEKLFMFTKLLSKKLPKTKEELPTEVLESVDIESYKLLEQAKGTIQLDSADGQLEPMNSGETKKKIEEKGSLSSIVKEMNDRFGTEFTTEDIVDISRIAERLIDNSAVQGAIKNNSIDVAKLKFDQVLGQELIGMFKQKMDFYKKLDKNPELKSYFGEQMYGHVRKEVVKQ
jgi:type I restriction enzyme, R subunit